MNTEFVATPVKISTITMTGSLGCSVDLDLLYEGCEPVVAEESEFGIVYIEFGPNKFESYSKGVRPRTPKGKSGVKRFDNQISAYMKVSDNCMPNVKIFQNGNIQMTGLKQIEQGEIVIQTLVDLVKQTEGSKENLGVSNLNVDMINSDYRINYTIRRDHLYDILLNTFKNDCYFEPDRYPGVKLRYFWRDTKTENGNCPCIHSQICRSKNKKVKGMIHEGTPCEKITVLVFQSGSIIITGAKSYEQISECYEYMNAIFRDYIERLEKIDWVPNQFKFTSKEVEKDWVLITPVIEPSN